MAEIVLPPSAPALVESMRAMGYSLESAVADLIDNSITAGASRVSIQFRCSHAYVALLDDGCGMAPNELTEAMRHGSQNPLALRGEADLGRFGLGLKTASLSQCRRLTVVSVKDGTLSARCWDLDLIAERREWVLLAVEPENAVDLPHVAELQTQASGTLVLWQKLDRIAAGEVDLETALGEKMDRARHHLALVFHRFLAGEPGLRRLHISINNNALEPSDPYLSNHRATQPLPEETFLVDGETVRVQPYILPHIDKLSPDQLSTAGGEAGLRRNQGFYIYRNRRLIIWGTWFHLCRQEELTKLARVRVDSPNSLDHLWTLDIKKSKAHPPEEVRMHLRRIVGRIGECSKHTYRSRGRPVNPDSFVHAWNRHEARGGIRYDINREHPLVEALSAEFVDSRGAQLFRLLLETLETTFPADSLYADLAGEARWVVADNSEEARLRLLAKQLALATGGAILKRLHSIEPFCYHRETTQRLIEELSDDD